MMEELLAALGIEVSHQPQKQIITELCSYTKTTERKIEIKIDLQSLCKEKNIDYKDVDKTVFVEEFTLEVELKKFNGELFFQTSLPLQDKKKIHFGSVVQRLDKPEVAKAASDKYKVWSDEDTYIENDIKNLLSLFLKEKLCVASVLYCVKYFVATSSFGHRFTVSAKMEKDEKTQRICSRDMESSLKQLFGCLKVHLETERLIFNSRSTAYWKQYAESQVAEQNKKTVEKKLRAEEEVKQRLSEEEKKRAEEAAALKLMFGRKDEDISRKTDSI